MEKLIYVVWKEADASVRNFKQRLLGPVAEAARGLTLAEAEARFEREEVPFGRVHTLDDLRDDPQVQANQIFVES